MKKIILILLLPIIYLGLTSFFPKFGVIVFETIPAGHYTSEFIILKKNSVVETKTYEFVSQTGQTSILGSWKEYNDTLFLYPKYGNYGGYVSPLEVCDDCPMSKTHKYMIKGDTLISFENQRLKFLKRYCQ